VKDFQEVSKNILGKFAHLSFHKRTKQLGHNLVKWSKRNKYYLNNQLKQIEVSIASIQAHPETFAILPVSSLGFDLTHSPSWTSPLCT
jgi:hypothetical protein